MNEKEFKNELLKLGIEINDEQLNKLKIYCEYLIQTNKKFNLTAITDPEQIYLKHFYDSLTLTKVINLAKKIQVLDIGTGAGFPGMVLKIIFPNIKITLLDSNNKKITFLKNLTDKLNLENVNLYHGRAEDYVKENREKFDIVTARAVSNLRVLSELCLPLTKEKGYFIALKGPNNEELKEIEETINILGGKIVDINEFKLPKENSDRKIIKIQKTKKTPLKYPRRYEQILKNPLKK